jgi:hypothetical protein
MAQRPKKSPERVTREQVFKNILDEYYDRMPDNLMYGTRDFCLANLSAEQLRACLEVLCKKKA